MVKTISVITSKMCDCCKCSAEFKTVNTQRIHEPILLCRAHYRELVDERKVMTEKDFDALLAKVSGMKRKK